LIAQVCNLGVSELVISTGDTHIYANHVEQVIEQLSREPLSLPVLKLNRDIKSIEEFKMDDIELVDYQCHTAIKADMAV
jgi:thymidylate synthase